MMGSWSYEGPTASIFSVPTISNHNSEKKLQEFWLHQQHRIPANLFLSQKRFCLGISENVPATSKDFRRFSEDLRTFPKISEDVPTNFEHLRSHLKGDKFSVFWKNYDTKSTLRPLYEIFLWKLPELNFLYWSCVKCQFVRIYESGVGNCPWCVTSMPLIWSADM